MENNNSSSKRPLLSQRSGEDDDQTPAVPYFLRPSTNSFFSSFVADSDDIAPITGFRDFSREFMVESRKLWYLAAPAVFTSLCQYSLGAITQTFAGHIGTLRLAAFSVENSVIAGFSFGVLLGMGSALETLCGQAFNLELDSLICWEYTCRDHGLYSTALFSPHVSLYFCCTLLKTNWPDGGHIARSGSWRYG